VQVTPQVALATHAGTAQRRLTGDGARSPGRPIAHGAIDRAAPRRAAGHTQSATPSARARTKRGWRTCGPPRATGRRCRCPGAPESPVPRGKPAIDTALRLAHRARSGLRGSFGAHRRARRARRPLAPIGQLARAVADHADLGLPKRGAGGAAVSGRRGDCARASTSAVAAGRGRARGPAAPVADSAVDCTANGQPASVRLTPCVPGQGRRLHDRVWLSVVGHATPPFAAGVTTVIWRVWTPPPQDAEQDDHSL
jgi:hypothetical protein